MRLDHIAYRVADRKKTAQFFIDALGYTIQEEFTIDFDDGTHADCIALEPPEKTAYSLWSVEGPCRDDLAIQQMASLPEYHTPPEIFVSDGEPGSIVGEWVAARSGIGGVHHIAYQVEDVEAKMKEWKDKGYAEFTSEKPLKCEDPPLTQIFTKPSELTGVVYEFINRTTHGFCNKNVKNLMLSSKNL
jgi:catechol 2,3-dioxygenase-like lactoylglutathione lyase family enzyme